MVRNKWLKFLLLYIGGVMVSLSQLKLVPIQTELAQSMNVTLSLISWLMSIFTVSGIFLAIPGGAFISKVGAKNLLVGLMGCLVIGNLLGGFSNNFWVLFVSRAVEGVSFSMIIMVGIVLINFWFKDSSSGVATGIWGTFSAFGSLLAMNFFPMLAKSYGLKSLWLLIAACALLLLVVYFFLLDEPQNQHQSKVHSETSAVKQALKNKIIWLLALAQGCMAFVLFAFINLYPLIYQEYYGLSEGAANHYTGYFGLFGIPFGALAGYLIDKTEKGKFITMVSFLLMFGATLWTGFLNQPFTIIAQLFLLSAGASLSSSCVMILAPKVVNKSSLIGASIAFINLFYYIGIFIGTPLVTKVAEVGKTWLAGIYLLSGFAALAVLMIIGFIKKAPKIS